jgi:predicted RNA-binding protein Jag
MKKKILVVQYYTDNLEYAPFSEQLNKQYCDKNGYDYHIEKDNDKIKIFCNKEEMSIQWYKVNLLNEVINEKPDYDWYLFLDIDALFCNISERIEKYVDDAYDLILADDVGAHSIANTGVILIKNNDWSKEFLSKWWEARLDTSGQEANDLMNWAGGMHVPEMRYIFKSSLWHEQTCLAVMFKKDLSLKDRIKILDRNVFNSHRYGPNSFIFHAYAYAYSKNRDIDKIYEAKYGEFDKTKKIKVIYFIYCKGDFINLAKKDLERIKESGLYNDLDEMHVVCSLEFREDEESYNKILEVFEGHDKVHFTKAYDNRFEHYGIVKAWIESQKSDGPIMYFHSKGVTNVPTDTNEHSEWKRIGDASFIEMLKYYMIDNYKNCLEKLKVYDQCNVSDSFGRGWPSGNFWWANSHYLRHNPYPYESTYDRWSSEAWINMFRVDYTCYQFYERFGWRDKFTSIPEASYKNPNSLADKRMILKSAKFMTLMEPENEHDRNRPTETNEVDFTEFVQENINNNEGKGVSGIIVAMDTMGRVIPDPCYGVKKSLVIEFNIEGDDTTYRLIGDEGQVLNYRIDKVKSEGYMFHENTKKLIY